MYDWKVYLRLGLAGMALMMLDWAFFEIAMIVIGKIVNIKIPRTFSSLNMLYIDKSNAWKYLFIRDGYFLTDAVFFLRGKSTITFILLIFLRYTR